MKYDDIPNIWKHVFQTTSQYTIYLNTMYLNAIIKPTLNPNHFWLVKPTLMLVEPSTNVNRGTPDWPHSVLGSPERLSVVTTSDGSPMFWINRSTFGVT